MRSIAAVGSGRDVATCASGTSRTAVAKRTAVGQSSANGTIGVQITDAIDFVCSLPLEPRELALEELTSAADRAKGIALDDENGRILGVRVAPSSSDFILQRLGDPDFGSIRSLCLVGELRRYGAGK